MSYVGKHQYDHDVVMFWFLWYYKQRKATYLFINSSIKNELVHSFTIVMIYFSFFLRRLQVFAFSCFFLYLSLNVKMSDHSKFSYLHHCLHIYTYIHIYTHTSSLSMNGVISCLQVPMHASIYLGVLSSHMQNFIWRINCMSTLQ